MMVSIWWNNAGYIYTNIREMLFLFVSCIVMLRKVENIQLELVKSLTSLLRLLTNSMVSWKNSGVGKRDLGFNSSFFPSTCLRFIGWGPIN